MSDFFGKRAASKGGRFFNDLPGRDKGDFFQKASAAMAASSGAGMKPSPLEGKSSPTEVGATGAPVGGMGFRGQGVSGGMYGTGDGSKVAAASPSDWDSDAGIPSGFHRPTTEQPEELEDGGERFFSSEARLPSHGVGAIRHGLLETGGMSVGPLEGHQIGKHASDMRFFGTSMEKAAYDNRTADQIADKASDHGRAFGSSVKKGVKQLGSRADEGISSVTQSPTASLIAAGLMGFAGYRGLRGLGRGAARLVRGKPAAPPPGVVGSIINKAKSLLGKK